MVEVVTTDEFATWYASLEEAHKDEVDFLVELLQDRGIALGHPYSSALKATEAAFRELRGTAGKAELRIVYAFDPRRDAVLIIGGDKRGQALLRKDHQGRGEDLGGVPHGARLREAQEKEVEDAHRRGALAIKNLQSEGRRKLMGIHKWKDVRAKNRTPEQVARVDRRVQEELRAMDLRAIREAAGITQEELAERMNVTQGHVSKLERGDLDRLSSGTLRKVIAAVGGELEVTAIIKGKRIRLSDAAVDPVDVRR